MHDPDRNLAVNAVADARGWDAVQIAPEDHVAVALHDLSGVVRVRRGGDVFSITVLEPIPLGHKFALADLASGTLICKFGSPIGRATRSIARGAHVHTHNIISERAKRSRPPEPG